MEYEVEKHHKLDQERALVIGGAALTEALSDPDVKMKLIHLVGMCKTVLACRVSPDQKQQLLKLIKDNVAGARCLAIGDGANDVAMIQQAHVGVGIRGEEGLQAVNASDYAISQFRFLLPLLLKHGRYNYVRIVKLMTYTFYKNELMSLAQFWFNWSNGFSGQKYYSEVAIQLYNILCTSVPIILLAVMDTDIKYRSVKRFPQFYRTGMKNQLFNRRAFWVTLADAFIASAICSVGPLYLIPKYARYADSFWQCGMASYIAVVCVANLKLFSFQCRWRKIHYFFIFTGILSAFGIYAVMDSARWSWVGGNDTFIEDGMAGLLTATYKYRAFYMSIIWCIGFCLMKDAAYIGYSRLFDPSNIQIVQAIEAKGGFRLDDRPGMHRLLAKAEENKSLDDAAEKAKEQELLEKFKERTLAKGTFGDLSSAEAKSVRLSRNQSVQDDDSVEDEFHMIGELGPIKQAAGISKMHSRNSQSSPQRTNSQRSDGYSPVRRDSGPVIP